MENKVLVIYSWMYSGTALEKDFIRIGDLTVYFLNNTV